MSAVLVVHDWWGPDAHVSDAAARLASAGLATAAPDLYEGRRPATADEASRFAAALDAERAIAPLLLAADELRDADRRLGVLGFGLGGALALGLACAAPDVFGACVVFYPRPAPLLELPRLAAPVLGIFGAHDPYVTARDARELQSAIRAARGRMDVILVDAGHGFAPELAWPETLSFFSKALR